MQIGNNFELEDFVSKAIYTKYQANALWYIDRRIIVFLEQLRKYLKTEFVINTWHYKDENIQALNQQFGTHYDLINRLELRGFREINSPQSTDDRPQNKSPQFTDDSPQNKSPQSTVNSPQNSSNVGELSQHRFGKAVDFDALGMSADEVRDNIIKNFPSYKIYGLAAIELGTPWVHIDFRLTGFDRPLNVLIQFTK